MEATTITRTDPQHSILLPGEQPVDGWEGKLDHPYCPTFIDMGDGLVVFKTPVAFGGITYRAYERQAPGTTMSHSTIRHLRGAWYGEITSRRAPEIEAMKPLSDERYQEAVAFLTVRRAEAKALIRRAFPDREFRDNPISSTLEAPQA